MRIRDVLEFALNQLNGYDTHVPSPGRFYDMDNTAVQKLKAINQKIRLTLQQEDNDPEKDANQSRHAQRHGTSYHNMIGELETIIKGLTRHLRIQQKGGDLNVKEESPLAEKIRTITTLINDKYKVVETMQYRQAVEKIHLKMQQDEEELKTREKALQEKEKECQLALSSFQEKEKSYQLTLNETSAKVDKSLSVLAKIFSAMPPEMQKKFQEDVRELNVSASADGAVSIAVTFEEPHVVVRYYTCAFIIATSVNDALIVSTFGYD